MVHMTYYLTRDAPRANEQLVFCAFKHCRTVDSCRVWLCTYQGDSAQVHSDPVEHALHHLQYDNDASVHVREANRSLRRYDIH